jgi:hypothetical protein
MAVGGNSRIQRYTPPQSAQPRLTPNQADRAAEAARASAAARAEAARQTKAQVERAERAEAERIAWVKANGPRSADAMERWLRSPAAKPSAPATTTSNTNNNRSSTNSSSAASSSTTASNTQSQTQAEPPAPPEPGAPPVYAGIKAAPIDTVVFVDEPYDETFYADALFEDFGGQEILSVTRADTVNGQDILYQPFKDLKALRNQYSPNILTGIQQTSDSFFANFLINLNQKIPETGDGPNGEASYIDPNTGSAVIEFINIEDNQQVEIQILNAGIIEDLGV